jgi:curved DNA-binding protein CbpA
MVKIDDNVAPRARPNVDFKSLDRAPTPEEFFVLSRIDGAATVAQLSTLCGLGREKTAAVVGRLLEFGLIELPGGMPAMPSPQTSSPNTAEKKPAHATNIALPLSLEEFDYSEELLSQHVELDDDFKREVICVHAQLSDMSHYALFGVSPEASRKEIRSAYFALSKRFHPDNFFRRLLGDYGPMIEKIFQRITKAYQVLSNAGKRAEYDAVLSRGHHRHGPPVGAVTSGSQRRESVEDIASGRKREMAFHMLVKRGDALLAEQDYSPAIDEYRKALSLKRDAKLAMRVAAALVSSDQRVDDAMAFARAALKIEPENIDAYVILGEIYAQKNSHDEALFHFERALKLAPKRPDLAAKVKSLLP